MNWKLEVYLPNWILQLHDKISRTWLINYLNVLRWDGIKCGSEPSELQSARAIVSHPDNSLAQRDINNLSPAGNFIGKNVLQVIISQLYIVPVLWTYYVHEMITIKPEWI